MESHQKDTGAGFLLARSGTKEKKKTQTKKNRLLTTANKQMVTRGEVGG